MPIYRMQFSMSPEPPTKFAECCAIAPSHWNSVTFMTPMFEDKKLDKQLLSLLDFAHSSVFQVQVTNIIKEVAVMSNSNDSSLELCKIPLQPSHSFCIQMICRLIQKQHIWCLHEKPTLISPTVLNWYVHKSQNHVRNFGWVFLWSYHCSCSVRNSVFTFTASSTMILLKRETERQVWSKKNLKQKRTKSHPPPLTST